MNPDLEKVSSSVDQSTVVSGASEVMPAYSDGALNVGDLEGDESLQQSGVTPFYNLIGGVTGVACTFLIIWFGGVIADFTGFTILSFLLVLASLLFLPFMLVAAAGDDTGQPFNGMGDFAFGTMWAWGTLVFAIVFQVGGWWIIGIGTILFVISFISVPPSTKHGSPYSMVLFGMARGMVSVIGVFLIAAWILFLILQIFSFFDDKTSVQGFILSVLVATIWGGTTKKYLEGIGAFKEEIQAESDTEVDDAGQEDEEDECEIEADEDEDRK